MDDLHETCDDCDGVFELDDFEMVGGRMRCPVCAEVWEQQQRRRLRGIYQSEGSTLAELRKRKDDTR